MSTAAGCSVPWDWQPDAHAPQWHRRQPHIVLRKLFDSGYVTQADAYKCMRVCRQWHDCVNEAANVWRTVEFRWHGFNSTANFDFANWSDGVADAVAAKRPSEIAIYNPTARRQHLAAILERCVHLRRLTVDDSEEDTVRALDSIVAPLTSLTLSNIYGFDATVFAEILASVPTLRLLKELRLVAFWIGNATAVAQLIAAHFTQLDVLQMAGLTSSAVRHLCAGAAHTRGTLKVLNLDNCDGIEDDVAEDILAMTNLQVLSVKCVRMCTDEWAADLQRRYEERHNRHIDVLTEEVPYEQYWLDLHVWPDWLYIDGDVYYRQDEGDDYEGDF